MLSRRGRSAALLLALVCVGCGGSGPSGDAGDAGGTDATPGTDALVESGTDAGPDDLGAPDADVDGGVDMALCFDTDGDGIDDATEGTADTDGDGMPDANDTDADGDGVPDATERASAACGVPRDSDGDTRPDFLQRDADGDGVADGMQTADTDGDTLPDFADLDDDGDGASDLVEWGAGTDPHDASSVPSGDPAYVVTPYLARAGTLTVTFAPSIRRVDIVMDLDTTGSMGGTINTIQTSLQTVIVPNIALTVPDVAFGVAFFKDFPVSPFGDAIDTPHRLVCRVTNVIDDVQSGVDRLSASGGSDGPEAHLQSFYQVATGEGLVWTVGTPGEVPAFDPLVDYDPAHNGMIGGAGFRDGALPVLIGMTDIEWHEAPDYWAAGITSARTRDQTAAALVAIGARYIGVTSSTTARVQHEQLSRDTGAAVTPEAWGAGMTFCATGIGGAPRPPDADGTCPLTFDMEWGGSGVDTQLVSGVRALASAPLDVTVRGVGDPAALPLVDTSGFVLGATPLAPGPTGTTIDGSVLRDVPPTTPVDFAVELQNTFAQHGATPVLYRVVLRAAQGVAMLDEHEIFVIVPGGG